MPRDILLVEPSYRNKYPPLGLMKISTYHKLKGDRVQFVKGCKKEFRTRRWDRVYVSTLFTFLWKTTVDTIFYYQSSVEQPTDVFVGGITATLLRDDLLATTGTTVLDGLLDKPGILDPGDRSIIDQMTPDYKLLEQVDYKYALSDAYIGYATRGCPNRCGFCAVHCLEREYRSYLPLKRQVRSIEEVYGPKQDLVLLDNNVLASENLIDIMNDLEDLGFQRGARHNNKNRHVDFNQGIDSRLVNKSTMKQLSRVALKPLRIAFDHIALQKQYTDSIRMAVDHGIIHLSNYVLYNYKDSPQDFYERLRINVELNQELGVQIYSFPMKYIPLDAKDRKYVGPLWTKRLLRGVQCILLATKGSVGTKLPFFEAAFGRNSDEFIEIAAMPETYIIQRKDYAEAAEQWKQSFRKLTPAQRLEFLHISGQPYQSGSNSAFSHLFSHYEIDRKNKAISKTPEPVPVIRK